MNNIVIQFLILTGADVIMLLITTFCLNAFLNMKDIKKENKKFYDTNAKFSNIIIKQQKEIEKLNIILEEYRNHANNQQYRNQFN